MPTYEYRCETCGEIFEQRKHRRARNRETAMPQVWRGESDAGFLGLLCQEAKKS
jgi:hypothetical protein